MPERCAAETARLPHTRAILRIRGGEKRRPYFHDGSLPEIVDPANDPEQAETSPADGKKTQSFHVACSSLLGMCTGNARRDILSIGNVLLFRALPAYVVGSKNCIACDQSHTMQFYHDTMRVSMVPVSSFLPALPTPSFLDAIALMQKLRRPDGKIRGRIIYPRKQAHPLLPLSFTTLH